MEEVLRRIARSGEPLDHVEIACPMPEQAALVWEKAQRHEWPVTIGPGIPVALTRPGRALLAFGEWVAGGLAASRLRRMLQSGDVRLDADGLTAGQAARLLARAQATWGRQTYAAALGRLIESWEARADDPERADEERARYRERGAQAERLKTWIGALLALVPEPGVAPLWQWLDAAVAFVKTFARKASELDGEAAVALSRGARGPAGARRPGAPGVRRPRADPRALRGPHGGRRPRAAGAPARHHPGRRGPRRAAAHVRDRPRGGRRVPRAGGGSGAARRGANARRPRAAHLGGPRWRGALPHRVAPGQPGRPRLPELLLPRPATGARDVPVLAPAAGGARAEARGELDLRPAGEGAGRARLRGAGRAGPGAERRGLVAREPATGRRLRAAGGARGLPRPGAGRGGRGRAGLRRVHRPRRARARGRAASGSARVGRGRVAHQPRGSRQVSVPLLSSSAGSGSIPSTIRSPIPTCGSIR